MAFPAETIDDGLVGAGPIIFKIENTAYGRVLNFEIDTASGTAEISHGTIDQIIAIIETANGSGKITVTLDEIHDIDDIEGHATTYGVELEQEFPLGTAVGMNMSAAKAFVRVLGYSGGRGGEKSTMRIEVIPYNGVGTEPWVFTNTESYA